MAFWIEPTPTDKDVGICQPQSPYNNCKSSESGHYMEMDDTPTNERVRIQHRIGSFQEYQASGNVVHKIIGNGYHIVLKDNNVQIQGQCHVTIVGDTEMEVQGNLYARVKKKAEINVDDNCNLTVKGKTTLTSEGTFNLNCNEDIFLTPSGSVFVNSDLNVRGAINGQQSISAFGNLTAGGHLGVQGSLNVVGGKTYAGGPILPHIVRGIAMTTSMTGKTNILSAGQTKITGSKIDLN